MIVFVHTITCFYTVSSDILIANVFHHINQAQHARKKLFNSVSVYAEFALETRDSLFNVCSVFRSDFILFISAWDAYSKARCQFVITRTRVSTHQLISTKTKLDFSLNKINWIKSWKSISLSKQKKHLYLRPENFSYVMLPLCIKQSSKKDIGFFFFFKTLPRYTTTCQKPVVGPTCQFIDTNLIKLLFSGGDCLVLNIICDFKWNRTNRHA